LTENTQQPTTEEVRRADVEETLSVVSTLTGMQRRFLIEYLAAEKPNATSAAEKAGYSTPNKSGPRLLKNPKIREAIDEYFYAQEMSAREVIARLSQQAKAEYGRYLSWDSIRNEVYCNLESLLADGLGHLIKKVGYDRTGTDSAVQVVEFYDAHTALVDLGRYHGLFTDKTDLTTGGERIVPNIYIPDNGRDNSEADE
jgi:hypothetical protein